MPPPEVQCKIPRYDKATLDDVKKLKSLLGKIEIEGRVKKFEDEVNPTPKDPPAPSFPSDIIFDQLPPGSRLADKTPAVVTREFNTVVREQVRDVGNLFDGGIANVEITREAIKCDNPALWMSWLMPEVTPSKWQFETLMQMAGYLTPGKYNPLTDKTPITHENPFLYNGWMANGSGKDLVLLAAFATWFPVIHERNRVIVTSSSQDQIKFQTEVHIRDFCNRANKKFGAIYRSVQFHHVVPELGSEIKLFVTDEPGRAEGYHPFPGGYMALLLNECKTINESINDATERCTGYSHRIEVSSPGGKSGFLYNNAIDEKTIRYPASVKLGTYYHRRVTAFECPWIAPVQITRILDTYGENSPFAQSMIFANASELDSPVAISEYEYDSCAKSDIAEKDTGIGIGLDIAAGGDEDACFVRKGNRIIHSFFFRQVDTSLAAQLIDIQLTPWKNEPYKFRADNGGVGVGCIDNLVNLGWRVIRTNNQSPAFTKAAFLNLGAEQWFHVKRLIARKDIILPDVQLLRKQITNRFWRGLDSTQGKLALESKIEAKAAGRPSPDRADAFILCFASYYPARKSIEVKPQAPNMMNVHEFLRKVSRGEIVPVTNYNSNKLKSITMLDRKY